MMAADTTGLTDPGQNQGHSQDPSQDQDRP